jgi:hypothetical protein
MMGGMGTSAGAGDTPAGPGATPSLPEPAGPCPAGTTSVWLTDTSRPDPWVAEAVARELMVSLGREGSVLRAWRGEGRQPRVRAVA